MIPCTHLCADKRDIFLLVKLFTANADSAAHSADASKSLQQCCEWISSRQGSLTLRCLKACAQDNCQAAAVRRADGGVPVLGVLQHLGAAEEHKVLVPLDVQAILRVHLQ